MGFLRNIWTKLFGDWSSPSSAYKNFGQNLSNSAFVSEKNKGNSLIANDGLGNVFSSLAARLTGAQLTGAEREANQFSHDEAQLAFDREMQASNTAYQRKVADMQAAGINPMMAASSGVSVPASSTAASVSPSAAAFQMSDLLSLYRMRELLPLEKEQMRANIRMTEEQVREKSTTNKYLDKSEQLRLEGQEIVNGLSESRIEEVNQNISESKARVGKLIAETKSEEERRELIISEKLLNNANAQKVYELLPFEKAYMSAQTESARASAAFAFAQAAYQNGLLDAGIIETIMEESLGKARSARYQASIDKVKAQISGDIPFDSSESYGSFTENLIKGFGRLKNMVIR